MPFLPLVKGRADVAYEYRTKAIICSVTIRIYIFIYQHLSLECPNILRSRLEAAGVPVDFIVTICLEKRAFFTEYLLKTNTSLFMELRSGRDVLFTSETGLRFVAGARLVS